MWKESIPKSLFQALNDPKMVGDYKLSPQEEWFQPYEIEEVDTAEVLGAFDGRSTTSEGILSGAIRICNTGCEGYHVYVFSGPEAGSIWSDQRYPFGRLSKICSSLDVYLANLSEFGAGHIAQYEDLS
ncbi:hypothetical protein [Microbulbifer sp. ZKSA002]|uniref:hypothetical protein n=1 Tax=unclassified Microbulbifer TaxID=2619833 RepID=UPI004039003B